MLESELGKKTPLKKTEFLTGGPAGLLNYRCQDRSNFPNALLLSCSAGTNW